MYDVRGATHVPAYALRTTKLIYNRESRSERGLIFVIEEFSDSEIIMLYDNKMVKKGMNEDSKLENSLLSLFDWEPKYGKGT